MGRLGTTHFSFLPSSLFPSSQIPLPPKDHWFQFLQISVVLGLEVDFKPARLASLLRSERIAPSGDLLPLPSPPAQPQPSRLHIEKPFLWPRTHCPCPGLCFSPGTPLSPPPPPRKPPGRLQFQDRVSPYVVVCFSFLGKSSPPPSLNSVAPVYPCPQPLPPSTPFFVFLLSHLYVNTCTHTQVCKYANTYQHVNVHSWNLHID